MIRNNGPASEDASSQSSSYGAPVRCRALIEHKE
jgi:hypothetical protein